MEWNGEMKQGLMGNKIQSVTTQRSAAKTDVPVVI
jgi:hypothetical protein